MILMGIEHEFVCKDSNGTYLDFETAKYPIFQKIVDAFPYFENDERFFECKSLETKPKRCYIEGFERYNSNGEAVETIPKGLEIRTTPHQSVEGLIEEFANSYKDLNDILKTYGYDTLLTSNHPYKTSVTFKTPLNDTEIGMRTEDELRIATNALLWHGLHVNISLSDYSKKELDDLIWKVNYYVPYILPYSFSSPFYKGELFEGLSYRTYLKANSRKIIQVQNRKGKHILEFRGYDSCGDTKLLKSMLLLFKGLLLDTTLNSRASAQDPDLLRLSALKGFEDEAIKETGLSVLHAAKDALGEEGQELTILESLLNANDSYAKRIKQTYLQTGDIMESISNRYSIL